MSKAKELFAEKNAMVLKGQIVEAVHQFFAPNAKTIDFDGTITHSKAELVSKMEGFTGSIAEVVGITLQHASIENNVSFVEYIFNFKMKDGSVVLWHEILRSVWENDLIVEEQYFKG